VAGDINATDEFAHDVERRMRLSDQQIQSAAEVQPPIRLAAA
jgi:hypothetical protein